MNTDAHGQAKRICVITGTRAEYGLLKPLMDSIQECIELELQVIATGMHLSPEFGLTYRQIEADGIRINEKVEMLLSSDTPVGIAKSTGLGLIGIADALSRLDPSLIVLLGDRFEALSAAIAAMHARIPIAHLHGGEATEGATDEAIRHAITKMSHLHFVAAEPYRRRVIQMGEATNRVHLVGGLGTDAIARTRLWDRARIEKELGFKLAERNLLITYHPVTLEAHSSGEQFDELTEALIELPKDIQFIFTEPNSDTDGRVITSKIKTLVASNRDRAVSFTSLGQLRYWSLMQYASAVVGNSSSGLLETPSFGVPTVNIGDRQQGRLRSSSVIQCDPTRRSITTALSNALETTFQKQCRKTVNPYGEGGATAKIVDVLKKTPMDGNLLKKSFSDR